MHALDDRPRAVSRPTLARGLAMSYRQLDHACRRLTCLSLIGQQVGSGGTYQLTADEIMEVRRTLTVIDALIAGGINDRQTLDAVAQAAHDYEPGTSLAVWRDENRTVVEPVDTLNLLAHPPAVALLVRLPDMVDELAWLHD
jgi:hypothetical protein